MIAYTFECQRQCYQIWIKTHRLTNIEPSINAISDLSNDGGSSKRGSIIYSYSRVRYKIVIEKQKRHEL